MRLLTLEIPFHKYYTSYHLLINQCHPHIIPLQYMSWRVSCFYDLSAYPRLYNSDHTNNTYIFVVLETVKVFLMKIINVFFKQLKVPLTLLTIEFFIKLGFNVSSQPILPVKCGIANATFRTFLLNQKFFCFCIMAQLISSQE